MLLLIASGCAPDTPAPTPDAPPPAPIVPEGVSVARALQQEFVAVVERVNPSVVLITSSAGIGSGVVLDEQGNVVTNAHVVGSATRLSLVTADGREHAADLVGSFPLNDIAVIRVRGDGPRAGLVPARFADAARLQVGDIVLAIGNPLGLQSSVTEGIVSATGRFVMDPAGISLPDVIQTSAAVNPGNSGGALVNLDGEVVGIPTLAALDPRLGGAAPGIGFAIPSDTVLDIAQQLIEHGRVIHTRRAYLGIQSANVTERSGVLVYDVVPGGPAQVAGIEPGSLLLAVGDIATPDNAALASALAEHDPGDTVTVHYLTPRGDRVRNDVTLGEMPGS